MLFNNLPEAPSIRVGRHTFEHQGRRAVRKGAVHDIAMPCDPAYIRGTPVNVTVLIIEHMLVRVACVQKISACGVQNTLRLAG